MSDAWVGLLVVMAFGIGFAAGARWVWVVVMRAFDEYERNHR